MHTWAPDLTRAPNYDPNDPAHLDHPFSAINSGRSPSVELRLDEGAGNIYGHGDTSRPDAELSLLLESSDNVINDLIRETHTRHNGEDGWLGPSVSGIYSQGRGWRQNFVNGSIFFSYDHGRAHAVPLEVAQYFDDYGGPETFGEVTTDFAVAENSTLTQLFNGGRIDVPIDHMMQPTAVTPELHGQMTRATAAPMRAEGGIYVCELG